MRISKSFPTIMNDVLKLYYSENMRTWGLLLFAFDVDGYSEDDANDNTSY